MMKLFGQYMGLRSRTNVCFKCRKQLNFPRRYISKGEGSDKRNSYFGRLKWVPIPVTVGFAYIGYQQYNHIIKREEAKIKKSSDPQELLAKDWVVALYKCFPLKILSRVWGKFNELEIPKPLRSPLFKVYIRLFKCNMEEVDIQDLEHYKNLSEFFNRRLKPSARPVDVHSTLVCPSDGKVLHFDCAEKGVVEQVKGITYALQELLGPVEFTYPEGQNVHIGVCSHEEYHRKLKRNKSNEIYHCVIYLAPGDYHGFHSPVEWTVVHRRHFPGELFSVNPGICRLIRGLFNLNERAVYVGEWEHGFFSMVAVGATNVGSVKIYHDKKLETNMPYKYPAGAFFDQTFIQSDKAGINMERGDPFGEFKLGSTIILVFEAPPSFEFDIETGQTVKYGQSLGHIKLSTRESQAG